MTEEEEWRQVKREMLMDFYLRNAAEETKAWGEILCWIAWLGVLATLVPFAYMLGCWLAR